MRTIRGQQTLLDLGYVLLLRFSWKIHFCLDKPMKWPKISKEALKSTKTSTYLTATEAQKVEVSLIWINNLMSYKKGSCHMFLLLPNQPKLDQLWVKSCIECMSEISVPTWGRVGWKSWSFWALTGSRWEFLVWFISTLEVSLPPQIFWHHYQSPTFWIICSRRPKYLDLSY